MYVVDIVKSGDYGFRARFTAFFIITLSLVNIRNSVLLVLEIMIISD